MLTSGLFMDSGRIIKKSDISVTFQSIVAAKTQASTPLMDNSSKKWKNIGRILLVNRDQEIRVTPFGNMNFRSMVLAPNP